MKIGDLALITIDIIVIIVEGILFIKDISLFPKIFQRLVIAKSSLPPEYSLDFGIKVAVLRSSLD